MRPALEHVVILGSLSKTYAMTGWRAGFALGPKQIIGAMSKLQSQSTSNTASVVSVLLPQVETSVSPPVDDV